MIKRLYLLLMAAVPVFACGPYFPSSYLSDYNDRFEADLNPAVELELIALEYHLIDEAPFPDGTYTTLQAEKLDFTKKAEQLGGQEWLTDYMAYAKSVRAAETNVPAPAVPNHLQEFTLYLEGTAEFRADEKVTFPQAWRELLALDVSNRLYRTEWVYYMRGNLAGAHGMPEQAGKSYAACRTAAREIPARHSLGLAHASYKRDYLCQTNLAMRIERGLAATGYYHRTGDFARRDHCMNHLRLDVTQASQEGLSTPSAAVLETMALFNIGKTDFIRTLEQHPDLKITPRLAWFMYKNGEPRKAAAYLEHCPADDILANWLRYRLAQRSGRTDEAIEKLRQWLNGLQHSRRIIYRFDYTGTVSPASALHGSLGTLYADRGQMLDALESFVAAGAYPDAALIAERYVETDDLQRYVDAFQSRTSKGPANRVDDWPQTETPRNSIELRLSYLLARRLFREGRPQEALPYYPTEIGYILQTYLHALKESRSFWNSWNTRAAHLYHAARIMRWKGMELCGTELYPDYTIVEGFFPSIGIEHESAVAPENMRPLYDKTAPIPNQRFHYRQIAAEQAGDAAVLAWNRHQKAMMLWSAGTWIKDRHPDAADVYYKKLARLHFQSLAKTADAIRWFPEGSDAMQQIHHSEQYIRPRKLSDAAKAYAAY
ncbi:hypothetical protein [Pontiella agarivorans]|uniref:Tetratricopeptide repeat-containing protein n=1 Tax=Pontiella agarivorans TaxID=3038953 RepID=A0ABU5MUL2_9BACT|nr:hypothetical protein [Pontiella agarivorans]MDZ8117905.1 hypothetical protein [Pontiella agarivorans]